MSQSLCSKALMSVRLVVMDHYMASPIHSLDSLISDFKGTPVRKVPVLRVLEAPPLVKHVAFTFTASSRTCMCPCQEGRARDLCTDLPPP